MNFYDTNCLIDAADEIFNSEEEFYISNITLKELENIKTSSRKDEDIKYAARHALHLLHNNVGKYNVVTYISLYDDIIKKHYLPPSEDSQKILI